MQKKILVLGSKGLLGSEFTSNIYINNCEIIKHSRNSTDCLNADLSSKNDTTKLLNKVNPDTILNLAGLTNVDHCERNPNEAYIGNVKIIENLTSWILQNKKETHLIQISTDQIYDGPGPHSEINISLNNYYAFSKYAGELVAKNVNSTILRTNFFGKSKARNRTSLTDWIFSALCNSQKIQVFEDVKFSPLSLKTLCKMIAIIIENNITGLYNLGSNKGMSKADFAFLFTERIKMNTDLLKRISADNANFLKCYRPKDMRLNIDHFENHTGITLPTLESEIINVAEEYI
jgi:dTDP-4-dehydrorhamnose reductase